jgi:hypothetical protein
MAKSHWVSSLWVAGDECLRLWQRMTALLSRANFQALCQLPNTDLSAHKVPVPLCINMPTPLSDPPRTRQRVRKPAPDLTVPDIQEDAAERKRVLGVLAQRRYREPALSAGSGQGITDCGVTNTEEC